MPFSLAIDNCEFDNGGGGDSSGSSVAAAAAAAVAAADDRDSIQWRWRHGHLMEAAASNSVQRQQQ